MDDYCLFDDDEERLLSDFHLIQRLLADRGLAVNPAKTEFRGVQKKDTKNQYHFSRKPTRRPSSVEEGGYEIEDDYDSDDDLEDDEGIGAYEGDERAHSSSPATTQFLANFRWGMVLRGLRNREVSEEKLLSTFALAQPPLAIIEHIDHILVRYPSLTKHVYMALMRFEDREAVAGRVLVCIEGEPKLREFQLFWIACLLEERLLGTSIAHKIIDSLLEHPSATTLSRAKVLELPYLRHGFSERKFAIMREKTGWEAWASAVGCRSLPKIKRSYGLKYFAKKCIVSAMLSKALNSAK
jgi:hypothetical protein